MVHLQLDDIHHVHQFKLAIFGKKGSGKSSIVIRYITDNFIQDLDDKYSRIILFGIS